MHEPLSTQQLLALERTVANFSNINLHFLSNILFMAYKKSNFRFELKTTAICCIVHFVQKWTIKTFSKFSRLMVLTSLKL